MERGARYAIVALILSGGLAVPAHAQTALQFDGADVVSMGPAADLGVAEFTIECWFRRLGPGEPVSTGELMAVPLVTKGRNEHDETLGGGTYLRDLNYFLGLHHPTGRLVADIEEHASGPTPGVNHAVVGVTAVEDDFWHHAAATYDGTCWQLFLDGVPETSGWYCPEAVPNFDSEQHFGLGTAVDGNGVAEGYFKGAIDEVRIWRRALSANEIRSLANTPLFTAPDLVGRWGLDEGAGQVAVDSIGVSHGRLGESPRSDAFDPRWVDGAPFDLRFNPDEPVVVEPAADAEAVPLSPLLRVRVTDPDEDAMSVTFHEGRPPESFSIVVLPDTQKYTCFCAGGHPDDFETQTRWIVDQRERMNIVFCTHLGDCVQSGNQVEQEWQFAEAAMSRLEDPVATGLPEGIPFGISVGNHDQTPLGWPQGETTALFNKYFGVHRFEGRAYYGDHYGDNNDNSYQLFSVAGMDFIVLHLEYDPSAHPAVLNWADAVLEAHADRRAIIVSHYLITNNGGFSTQGSAIYSALKSRPNLFLMLSGHISGEGRRVDVHDGNTVHTLLSNYQSRINGGDGWLRILEFNPVENEIRVRTFSPITRRYEIDADSDFVIPYEMGRTTSSEIGTVIAVPSGGVASVAWPGRDPQTTYDWYVTAGDGPGGEPRTSDVFSFTTVCSGTGADLNGDGLVDVQDLIAVIGGWGPCPEPCPGTCCDGEIDGDCVVGVTDLTAVLINWGGEAGSP